LKNSISQLDQAYEICRKETQKWAKTFYLGTLLLPEDKRKALLAISVWCRSTDEIMDSLEASTKSEDELSDNLDAWEENTKNIFKGKYLDCGTLNGYIKSSIKISKVKK